MVSLLGIGAAMVAMGEIMRANRELVEARAEMARLAVADERARFARDLHDLLGHSLSVIALKAQLARRRLPHDPETAAVDVADIEAVTRDALREVREAVSGYHRPVLDAELEGARTALGAAGIETTIDRPAVALPPDVEAVLAWTVREAATNVIRHSGARHSAIRLVPALGRRPSRSSTTATAQQRHANGAGTGLIGLEARVRDAGGRLEAGPRDDGPGFRVRAIVPVELRAVIRVLLAEDQAMVRGALAGLLSLEPDIEVVAQVARGDEVLAAALEQRPDVALLDIEMPGADGLEAAAQLRGELPDCKVLMLTTFGRPGLPAPRHGAGRRRLPAQGRSSRGARPRHPPRDARRARRRSRPRRGRAQRGPQPADPARARRPVRRARARDGGRHRVGPAPLARDGAQLPLGGDGQGRGRATAPRRSAPPRRRGGCERSVYHPLADSER